MIECDEIALIDCDRFQAIKEGSINRNLVVGELSKSDFSTELLNFNALKGGLIFCITIYNEPEIALQSTIKSLIESIKYSLSASTIAPETTITICIVADGINKLSNTTNTFFETFGIYLSEIKTVERDLIYFKNEFLLTDLIEYLEAFADSTTLSDFEHENEAYAQKRSHKNTEIDFMKNSPKIQFVFLLKRENAGKLDSHWWFYHVFCPTLSPEICFQIDVGTMPTQNCISEMLRLMKTDANIGAVASSIFVTKPKGIISILDGWQYFTFMKCMAQEWAAEVESGYLSVIPGQLSAIKWNAISYQQDSGPLVKYFRGLEELAPHEAMLYMAEDRVLCNEIVIRKPANWRLAYSPSAAAVTDSCESWNELFRQRRRWCNSYLACRLNFLSKAKEIFFDKNKSFNQKKNAFTAVLYQLFLLIKDWGFPSILFLSYQNLFELAESNQSLSEVPPFLSGLWNLVIISSVFVFLTCLRGKLDRYSSSIFIANGTIQVAFIFSCIALLAGSANFTQLLVLSSIYFVLLSVSVWILRGKGLADFLKFSIPCMLILCPVWFLVWTYSICNGHDNSWGTKGLISNNTSIKTKSHLHFSKTFFRYSYLSLWIICNLLFGKAFLMLASAFGVNIITLILSVLVLNSAYSVLSIKKIMLI